MANSPMLVSQMISTTLTLTDLVFCSSLQSNDIDQSYDIDNDMEMLPAAAGGLFRDTLLKVI